jgi:hypothetical protein
VSLPLQKGPNKALLKTTTNEIVHDFMIKTVAGWFIM